MVQNVNMKLNVVFFEACPTTGQDVLNVLNRSLAFVPTWIQEKRALQQFCTEKANHPLCVLFLQELSKAPGEMENVLKQINPRPKAIELLYVKKDEVIITDHKVIIANLWDVESLVQILLD